MSENQYLRFSDFANFIEIPEEEFKEIIRVCYDDDDDVDVENIFMGYIHENYELFKNLFEYYNHAYLEKLLKLRREESFDE